jgi:hypothetical protein
MEHQPRIGRKFIEPTLDEKKYLYSMYVSIYNSHFSLSKKRSVMTAVLGYELWSWRVVGITTEAIRAIARNNFNKPSKMLARDHSQPRVQTYNRIFDDTQCRAVMPFDSWWDWIWEHDKTILMTNEEHKKKDAIPSGDIHPINPQLGYFLDAETAGWHQTKGREGAFIAELCKQHGIQY